MKRYAACGYDGSFRFKWQAKLWAFFNKLKKKKRLKMATKKELIDMLEKYDDDAIVVCIGDDGGWDNIETVEDFGSNVAIRFGGGSPFTDE